MTQIDGPETGAPEATPAQPVIVKKYANRRLYNTESSSYITLDNLADMVRAGRDFVVYDARTGDDITRSVLTQIIVEEESKGHALLAHHHLSAPAHRLLRAAASAALCRATSSTP